VPDGPADVTSTVTVQGTADLPDLEKTIDAFLSKIPVKPFPRPKAVLKEAHDGLSLIDYRLKLEKSLKHTGGPAEGAQMLIGMKDDSQALRFQTALGLSKRLDDDATRILLDGLESADKAVRPQLVFALRGSNDPEVEQAFVDLYTADSDVDVRAQAAFVIGERGERLPPLLVERARQSARDDIRSDDDRLVTAAGDVLGSPPLSSSDRQMLETVLASDSSSSRRMAALRAMATAKVPPAELAPVLDQVAADESVSPELRNAVNMVLEALRNPTPPEGGRGD
jgi:hypothetical protein